MSRLPQQLTHIDLTHLWHPFTQQQVWLENEQPLIIERGEGCTLIDVEGRRYLDGVSSLWCNVHGHGVPELLNALHGQVDKLCHSTLLGLSHVPILELTEKLVRIVPQNLSRVFYSDAGTTAVEAALRMSVEWWQKKGTPAAQKKNKLVSLVGAYHGDTLGAVGVGYSEDLHRDVHSLVVQALRVPPPHVFRAEGESTALERSLEAIEKLFAERADEIAAFIVEPVVQGAAGIWVQPLEFLLRVAELCKRFNVLLIADEVATGFGKTGKMFAVEHRQIQPDLLVVGKGLTAGYLPMSAVVTTEELFEGFLGEPEELKTFFYGTTFTGNPLAARVASANLDYFISSQLLERLPSRISQLHQLITNELEPLSHVYEVRRCGLMVGIELTKTQGTLVPYPANELVGLRIVQAARKRGAIIRPLGNTVVLMPPLAMKEDELQNLVKITATAIAETLG